MEEPRGRGMLQGLMRDSEGYSTEKIRKREKDVSARIHSYTFTADEYDRTIGGKKGSFFKKHPDVKKTLDELYSEKVELESKLTKAILEGPSEEDDDRADSILELG